VRAAAKERLSILCRERFSGVPKTKESNEKRGKSIKKWINENPEKHQERMLKINKNPEKIQKTAETHRGMKRSDETKRRMSESKKGKPAKNKGMIWIHNPSSLERRYLDKNSRIPDGWVRGSGKRK
jgi:hypothetical protein